MSRFALVVALLLALPLPSAAREAPALVFPEYQALLDQYVSPLGAPGEPGDTRFDYEQLYVDEHVLKLHRSARLARVRAELLAVRPEALSPADRLAWAIDTYNFLVIDRITLHLLLPGTTRFVRYRNVDEMDHGPNHFYQAPVVDVAGRTYTLAEFERRFVYGDTAATPGFRLRPADPRIAFALCGGRVGSPPLAPRAYRADSLDRQLDLAARSALALPRFLHVDADQRQLEVSVYLQQQRADYGATIDAIVPFLLRYAPRESCAAIRRARLTHVTRLLPIEPDLNQRPHARNPDAGD